MRLSAGFTFMEVLVSILILSMGALGVAGLQLKGLQASQAAYEATQASAAIGDLLDRMRTNPNITHPAVVNAFTFNTGSDSVPANPGCANSGCNAVHRARLDVRDWRNNVLNDRLGAESAAAIQESGGVYTITITWFDTSVKDGDDDDGDGSEDPEQRSLTTQVRL